MLDLDLRSKIQMIADVETIKRASEYLSIMWKPTLHVIILRQTGSLSIVPASD